MVQPPWFESKGECVKGNIFSILRLLRDFLGIEVARSKEGISLS